MTLAYPFPQIVQDLDLHKRLMVEPLLVADNLDRYRLSCAVISAMQNLAERTFTKGVNDLVSECEVVVHDNKVVASLIVVAMVVRSVLQSRGLLIAPGANVVDRLVLENLLALVLRQVLNLAAFEDGYKE